MVLPFTAYWIPNNVALRHILTLGTMALTVNALWEAREAKGIWRKKMYVCFQILRVVSSSNTKSHGKKKHVVCEKSESLSFFLM